MKLKNKKTIGTLLAACFVVITAIWIVNVHRKEQPVLNNDCSAVFAKRDTPAHFSAKLNIYLTMRDNNTGFLDMAGTLSPDGVDTTIARTWNFDYRLQNGNTLHLRRIAMAKRAADNALDDLVDKLLFSTGSDNSRYVKIAVLNNAWVIGNLHSPQLVCVIHAA